MIQRSLPGSNTVTLTPLAAVEAGAAWSLDGRTNWNEGGATIVDLPVKTYSIVFRSAQGFTTPAATNVALGAGQAAVLGSEYVDSAVGRDCIVSQGFDDSDVRPWGWSVAYLDNAGSLTNVDMGSGAVVATNKVLVSSTCLIVLRCSMQSPWRNYG